MTPEQKQLLEVAENGAQFAYAPYSRFRVGAAVLTDKGVFVGANIENSSANLGICAERVAISHARMHGAKDFIGVAVSCIDADPDGDVRTGMPCGGCRQWLAELAPEAWFVTTATERVFSLEDLLPDAFLFKP